MDAHPWMATGSPLFGTPNMVDDPPPDQGSPGSKTWDNQASASPEGNEDGSWDVNEHHLSQIITTLGRLPPKIITALGNSRPKMIAASPIRKMYFKQSGRLKMESQYRITADRMDEVLVREFFFEPEEATALSAFITPLLSYDAEQRPTPSQLLSHQWLQPQSKPSFDEGDLSEGEAGSALSIANTGTSLRNKAATPTTDAVARDGDPSLVAGTTAPSSK
eukprot:gene26834-4431_t